ncbi:MAG: FAD-dependent monooxygenase [Hyphomonadaceae bacterium]|nr:FAD-dependent monooxygenase [Hyphomonadaceae bacterium]
MRIVVAGAGIGGLSAALALARSGHEVEVVERSGVIGEVGAGLQLSPNAMKGLAALGVAEAAEAVSSEPEALELRIGKSGGKVFTIPVGQAARKRYGAPYLHIHRADLVDILKTAAERAGVKIRLDARLAAFRREPDPAGLRIGLDTGDIMWADVLVGADGMRSTVRRLMFGAEHPRFTGAVAWRAIAPIEACPDLPNAAVVWAGAGKHAVTYRIRGGALINFVGVIEESDWQEEGWDKAGDKKELAAAFAGWAAPVTAVIGAARSCHRWALFDRDPLARWSEGRVTLLGDACHPMPPFQAQGAAMALEDAVVLARCLGGTDKPEAALLAYESKRKKRTAKVLTSARSNMGVFHRSNFATQAATYGPMRVANTVLPAFVRSRQDWIYSYDPAND